MAQAGHSYDAPGGGAGGASEHQADVVRSCREEIASYNDPTIMHKLQMQLAIAEERFEDATSCVPWGGAVGCGKGRSHAMGRGDAMRGRGWLPAHARGTPPSAPRSLGSACRAAPLPLHAPLAQPA